jgi:hypothetical protein
MYPPSSDPIENVYYGQIERSIKVCLENRCFDAAIKLIYSGIDTMAYLGMPAKQKDVERADFVMWVNKYIKFLCKYQLTGMDVYGARCSMPHSHGVVSRLSRQGLCRLVGYWDQSSPEVKFDPQIHPNLVMVSVTAFATAFFEGVHKFFIDLASEPVRAQVAHQRLHEFVQTTQLRPFPQK